MRRMGATILHLAHIVAIRVVTGNRCRIHSSMSSSRGASTMIAGAARIVIDESGVEAACLTAPQAAAIIS